MNARVVLASGPKQAVVVQREDVADGGQVICLENIGPAEQRKRLRFGIMAFSVGIAAALLLIFAGVNPLWRLLLFFPFAGGATGFFQAREKT